VCGLLDQPFDRLLAALGNIVVIARSSPPTSDFRPAPI
jgi:hypothetical protein